MKEIAIPMRERTQSIVMRNLRSERSTKLHRLTSWNRSKNMGKSRPLLLSARSKNLTLSMQMKKHPISPRELGGVGKREGCRKGSLELRKWWTFFPMIQP
ncbi:hypothetical protein IFM89_001311 [Coptis chinensis]|uniref:Uncharacterized protein n=1 Tax=Coptis chinensis TaxID=261450 RepID=A0A835ITJ0_9MAGN|nr:hypothetical protein IFM89_001311 [Coptis chinensis]